jgi:hypothetical protein
VDAAILTNRMRRILPAGVVLVPLALLIGCESTGPMVAGQPPPTPQALERPELRGIPVPEGFRLVPERSQSWERGGLREARCEFEGQTAPLDVKRFYDKYLPEARFTPGPWVFNNGEYTLRYQSSTEDCIVIVRSKAELIGRKTVLKIDVGPKTGAGMDLNPSSGQ